jgi:hypothetical protein
MKRFLLSAILAIATLVGVPLHGANYGDLQYAVSIVDQGTAATVPGTGVISSGILYWVYDAGTKTSSTVYSDRKRTAKTVPVSRAQFATDGQVLFYGPNASYDIFVAHSDGTTSLFAGVTPRVHRLSIDRSSNKKIIIVPFTNASAATEVDSGIDLPKNSLVKDVQVEVTTAESSKTISAGLLSSGTGGDADGFIVTASTTTAGYVATTTVTTGSNENYLSAFLYGALLGSLKVGVDTAGRTGQTLVSGYKVTGSNTTRISYTSSSGASTGAGNLYFFVDLLR